MLKNLGVATGLIAVTLTAVVFLTQSLRFLELVIDSGASSGVFWFLTVLALPRFLEIILPIAVLAGVIFTYNKMTMDSEIIAVKSVGYSPLALARPALVLALGVTVFLWAITLWIAPKSLSEMQHMRKVIKAQFSALLFREGVFNQVGNGLTFYIRDRSAEGELRGLMIHDSRDPAVNASTVLAKRGVVVSRPEGEQIVVFDGSRQEYNRERGAIQRLNFERYTIDLPETAPIQGRWREPEERTFSELLRFDGEAATNPKIRRQFIVEMNRRIAAPLIALCFTLIACAGLLAGPLDRKGQAKKIALVIGLCVLLQTLLLVGFGMARETLAVLPFLYTLVLVPSVIALTFLRTWEDRRIPARPREGRIPA